MTGQQIFDIAVGDLIGKRQSTGIIDAAKTLRWAKRTPGILTAWQNEMATILNVTTPTAITALTDVISIADNASGQFYLAAQLLLVEDPASSSYYNQKFEENRNDLLRRQPSSYVTITDSYVTEETVI